MSKHSVVVESSKPARAAILEIARSVRKWAEHHVSSEETVNSGYDFSGDPDLCCMCAYASTVLLDQLHKKGITCAKLVTNQYHCFIEIENNILDITATQFSSSFNKVVYQKRNSFLNKDLFKKRPSNQEYWEKSLEFDCVESAFKALNPSSTGGFPQTQYFKSKKELHKILKQADQFILNS